jgi:hypothetical protein
MTYEGWSNYATWNVSLWINNEYPYYQAAVEFMKNNPNSKNPYKDFVVDCGLSEQRTPDKIAFISQELNYSELNEMMRELI